MLPEQLDHYVSEDNPIHVADVFADGLDQLTPSEVFEFFAIDKKQRR